MSAHQLMKRMLDELMGTGRNGEDVSEKTTFDNARVCKCFLLNCCPHDVFAQTRCELGKCPKVHDYALRADYEAASKEKDYNFQPEVLAQLKTFIAETERRTVIAKHRLAETQQVLCTNETLRNLKVQAMDKKIEVTLAELEKLGAEGNVEESMKMMKILEETKKEKANLEKSYRSYVPNSKTQQQKLRVCEICSSYLGFEDDDERVADHFNGRLHLGYVFIRSKVDELENYIQDKHIRQFLDREFQSPKLAQNTLPVNTKPGNNNVFKVPTLGSDILPKGRKTSYSESSEGSLAKRAKLTPVIQDAGLRVDVK